MQVSGHPARDQLPEQLPLEWNGEAAVKKATKIVKRTGAKATELQALIQASNLAVARDGNCPADHFWSRQVRLPGHPVVRRDINVDPQVEIRKERQKRLLGKKFSNKTFIEHQKVRLQEQDTKRWSVKGERLLAPASAKTVRH